MQAVFHLMSGEKEKQKTALTIADNLLDDQSVDIEDVAVVAQSKGVQPLTAGSDDESKVQSLLNEGVTIKACGNTLDMMDIDDSDLVQGVETAPSGAGELVRLENEGYQYIRPE